MLSDIIITKPIEINKECTLDLNGHCLTFKENAHITINKGAKFTVTDSGQSGKCIKKEFSENSTAIFNNNGTISITGGTYTIQNTDTNKISILESNENSVFEIRNANFKIL